MKQSILNNWNYTRVLRLVIGIAILVQGILTKDILFGIAGLLFTAMAVFNAGCCGPEGCNVPVKTTSQTTKNIRNEELV
ncbi:MAG: hypothetical protein ABIP30_04420 [Ferruginibacter sp.]